MPAIGSSYLAAQMPAIAEHWPDRRQTSESSQSASVAATHAVPSSEHSPANAHCSESWQSAPRRATQAPFSAKHLPLATQGPLNAQSTHVPRQSASDAALHIPAAPRWHAPPRPHGMVLFAQPSSVATQRPFAYAHRPSSRQSMLEPHSRGIAASQALPSQRGAESEAQLESQALASPLSSPASG
jgi:hypothetical protein